MSNEITFTYPAIYYDDGEYIYVEIPDLDIEDFKIPISQRQEMVDIAWNKAAQLLTKKIRSGELPPPSKGLEELEVYEGNEKDAFLIELILNA